jgi:hypothetical protein
LYVVRIASVFLFATKTNRKATKKISAPSEKRGATMAEKYMYLVRWTSSLGISGEKMFFCQRDVDAFLRQMTTIISYSVEKVAR